MKKKLTFLLACTLLQVWPATFADGYSSDEEDLYEEEAFCESSQEEEVPKGTMYHLKNIGAYIVLDLVTVAVLCFLSSVVHYGFVYYKIVKSEPKEFGIIICVHMIFGLVLGFISILISGIVGIWVSNIAKTITGGSMVAILWLGFLFRVLKPDDGSNYLLATMIPIVNILGIVFANWSINTEKVAIFLHGSSVV